MNRREQAAAARAQRIAAEEARKETQSTQTLEFSSVALVPQLQEVAERLIKNIKIWPNSLYTSNCVINLDRILCMIDRYEGLDTQRVTTDLPSSGDDDVPTGGPS